MNDARKSFGQRWAPPLAGVLALGVQTLSLVSTPSTLGFRKYILAAEQWRAGELPAERLVDFSPAYLRLARIAVGRFDDPEGVLLGLHVVLVALAVAGLHTLFARRVSPGLAWLGTGILLLDRHLLVYTRVLEPEIPLLACLVGVALLLQHSLLEHGSDHDPANRRDIGRRAVADLAAGGLAGMAVALRPTFLPVFLAVPIYHALTVPAGRSTRIRWIALRSLFFLLPLVLIGPLLIARHAEWATDDPWAPTMNPGTVFFEGNHSLSRGTSAVYPPSVAGLLPWHPDEPDVAHVLYRDVVRAEESTATVADVNAFWSSRARAHLVDEPRAALDRFLAKARYAFHSFRWHDLPAAWLLDARLPIPTIPLAPISALAILGGLVTAIRWRETLARNLAFLVLAAVPLAVMLVFYVSARQRLILVPALVYFALLAVESLASRRGPIRRSIGVLLVVVLVPIFSWLDDAQRDEIHRRSSAAALDHGLAALRASNEPFGRHVDALVDAFAAGPSHLDALRPAWIPSDDATLDERVAEEISPTLDSAPAARRFDAAAILVALGSSDPARLDEAEALLESLAEEGFRAYRRGLEPSDPRILLARVATARGEIERAAGLLREVLDDTPGDAFALADLASLGVAESSGALAELARTYSRADVDWLVGLALRRADRPTEALVHLDRLAAALPRWRPVHAHRALALAALDRFDDAVGALLEANQFGPDPLVEPRKTRDLLERFAVAHPRDAEAQSLAAHLLYQQGFATAALARVEAARALDLDAASSARLDDLEKRIRTLAPAPFRFATTRFPRFDTSRVVDPPPR